MDHEKRADIDTHPTRLTGALLIFCYPFAASAALRLLTAYRRVIAPQFCGHDSGAASLATSLRQAHA
jgi:hypothetical protein